MRHGFGSGYTSAFILMLFTFYMGAYSMLYYALVFMIIGLVAGVLGLAGVATIASQIAWVLFLIGVILLVVQLVRGRPPAV